MARASGVEQIGDEPQHAIADAVAIGVVDPLEMVDVANGEADVGAAGFDFGELLLEGASVGQAVSGIAARLLAGFGELTRSDCASSRAAASWSLDRLGALGHRPGERDQRRDRAGAGAALELGRRRRRGRGRSFAPGRASFDDRGEFLHPLGRRRDQLRDRCRARRRSGGDGHAVLALDPVGLALGEAQAVIGGGLDRVRGRGRVVGDELVDERIIVRARPQAVPAEELADAAVERRPSVCFSCADQMRPRRRPGDVLVSRQAKVIEMRRLRGS